MKSVRNHEQARDVASAPAEHADALLVGALKYLKLPRDNHKDRQLRVDVITEAVGRLNKLLAGKASNGKAKRVMVRELCLREEGATADDLNRSLGLGVFNDDEIWNGYFAEKESGYGHRLSREGVHFLTRE